MNFLSDFPICQFGVDRISYSDGMSGGGCCGYDNLKCILTLCSY